MKILITGIPCVGKTTIADKLGKIFNLKVISDKSLLEKNMYTEIKYNGDKIKDVDITALKKKAQYVKDGVFEGFLFPEMKLKFDYIILLREKPNKIRQRMKKRGYNDLKIEENLFCQETNYIDDLIIKNLLKDNTKLLIMNRSTMLSDIKTLVSFIKLD